MILESPFRISEGPGGNSTNTLFCVYAISINTSYDGMGHELPKANKKTTPNSALAFKMSKYTIFVCMPYLFIFLFRDRVTRYQSPKYKNSPNSCLTFQHFRGSRGKTKNTLFCVYAISIETLYVEMVH